MATFEEVFVLPVAGFPRVLFSSDYTFAGATLEIGGENVLAAADRAALEQGVEGIVEVEGKRRLAMRLEHDGATPKVRVLFDGSELPHETDLRPSPSRSAWNHALLAFAASLAGFMASWLYLERADALASMHAHKMATHMAGWHLLLVVTLFPASVWGRRPGIRAVQATSALFFAIHAGIALANIAAPVASDPTERWIAFWNAASGLIFLATVFYGQRAWRDMDPARAIAES